MARYMNVHDDDAVGRPRQYHRDDSTDPLNELSDLELYKEYRFDKEGILYLVSLLQDALPVAEESGRGLPLAHHIIVMAGLLYLSSNAFQIRIARTLKISQASVSRAITLFVKAVASKVDMFVKFPMTEDERRSEAAAFYDLAGFPGVVSAIDGTHIRIVSPATDVHQYRCRKGFPSLNVQVACNAKGLFTNVVARWPGSTHDSYILRNSELFATFERGDLKGIVLGDSGYPVKCWLMTPLAESQTPAERRYNGSQKKTRVVIECAIGRLKKRFNFLHQEVRMSLDNLPAAIVSCVVLQNIIIKEKIKERVFERYGYQEEDEEEDAGEDDQPNLEELEGRDEEGTLYRRHLIHTIFENRN